MYECLNVPIAIGLDVDLNVDEDANEGVKDEENPLAGCKI